MGFARGNVSQSAWQTIRVPEGTSKSYQSTARSHAHQEGVRELKDQVKSLTELCHEQKDTISKYEEKFDNQNKKFEELKIFMRLYMNGSLAGNRTTG